MEQKEFINKTDEFTVNIALINNKKGCFGIVAAPVSGRTWIGQFLIIILIKKKIPIEISG